MCSVRVAAAGHELPGASGGGVGWRNQRSLPDLFHHHGARVSGRSGTAHPAWQTKGSSKKNPHCGSGSSFLPKCADPDQQALPDMFHHHGARVSGRSGAAHPSWQTKGSSKRKIRIVDPDPAFYLNARIRISDHSQTCFITTEPVCPDAPGPPTLLDKPKVAARKIRVVDPDPVFFI